MNAAAPLLERTRATPVRPLNLLAYVHLRNIHGSTGAGRVARQLTEHLALREDVNLHVLADAGDAEKILPLVEKPWSDFPLHTFAEDTSKMQARWFLRDRPTAEEFWPEAEVVFCTAESYVPTKRARLAVTLHDAAYFEPGAHRRDRTFFQQRMKWRALYWKMGRKADLFHTVSEFSAERLAHFFPQIRTRLRVVHNAVTPTFFAPTPDTGLAWLEAQGLKGREYVLAPGGLQFRKNADLLLEACALLRERHPDLLVVVPGHNDPAYKERAAALAPFLRMVGFVEDDQLHALHSNAAAMWFPSRYEGFGLPVVEAMACGAPVVCSSAASLPEIAGDAAVLVDPTRAGEHADALSALLNDAGRREELARRGRARAQQFTWTASAAKLKQCFDELT